MEDSNRRNSDRITRDYFDSILIEMRHMDGGEPDTSLELFGETFKTPVMMAALSHLNKLHKDGMVEMAKGAEAAGAVNWAGMGDERELERITATGARTIKIIKPYADNQIIFKKIEHAKQCGVLAVGMDIDHAFNSKGRPDIVLGYEMAPKSCDEIAAYVQASEIPFIIKGVLSERDAYKCMKAGAGGIVISHHHGIMDYAVPPLMVLPEILKVTAGEIPVFVDCGIVSGADVFKALAMGATAVSAGRVIMEPLGAEGAVGVKRKIEEMTEELKGFMARTGCLNLRQMDRTVLHKRTFS